VILYRGRRIHWSTGFGGWLHYFLCCWYGWQL